MDEDPSQDVPRPSDPRLPSNVYLVDDDSDGMPWLDGLVQRWNVRVSRCPSAERFLATVTPDARGVVIAEASLPGMNGLEMQQELVTRGYQLPMIIVARNGGVPVAVQALKEGAEDFLERPVVPQVLLRRILSMLSRADCG